MYNVDINIRSRAKRNGKARTHTNTIESLNSYSHTRALAGSFVRSPARLFAHSLARTYRHHQHQADLNKNVIHMRCWMYQNRWWFRHEFFRFFFMCKISFCTILKPAKNNVSPSLCLCVCVCALFFSYSFFSFTYR